MRWHSRFVHMPLIVSWVILVQGSIPADAQVVFEGQSRPVALAITRIPTDSVPPSIEVDAPARNLVAGAPVSERDSTTLIQGRATGHRGRSVAVFLGAERYPVEHDGSFSIQVPLAMGANTFVIRATDRLRNSCEETIRVYRDPDADKTPPSINVSFEGGDHPERNDASGDSVRASFTITDDSGVYNVQVDDVTIDPYIHERFDLVLSPVPDKIHVTAIDVMGNVVIRPIPVKRH
jgi:hypothetical protein